MIDIQSIIGVVLIIAVIVIVIKSLKHIVTAVILVVLLLVGSSLIFGSLPNLAELPVIGPVIQMIAPWIPTEISASDIILKIKNVFYSIDIMSVAQSSSGNIIAVVVNTGKFEQSNLTAKVNNQSAFIIQGPGVLKPGESGIFEIENENLPAEIFIYGKGGAAANYTLS